MRRVLITGGTGSVGRALIALFVERDYEVTFQYSRDAETATALSAQYGIASLQSDFLETLALGDARFDVLINNAGVNICDRPSVDVPEKDWDATLRINLTAPFFLAKQVIPHMVTNGWGRIVNVSSIYGLRGVEHNLPYTVSKHGLSGLTKTIAKEYAEYGITCNEICPGPIESDMMREIGERQAPITGVSVEDYLQQVRDDLPLKRMVLPSEIAAAAAFLASQDASGINGVSLSVDGGLTA